jgi:hypothetical protein
MTGKRRRAWSIGANRQPRPPCAPLGHCRALLLAQRPLVVLVFTYASVLVHAATDAGARAIQFTGGTFYGPGSMPDSPSPPGTLSHLELHQGLDGWIDVPGEAVVPGAGANHGLPDSNRPEVLSNGHPFNQSMDGGVVEVGRGAMRFHERVTLDGPGQGRARVTLDGNLSWHIRVDLALDPGFPEGLVQIEGLDITSGTVRVPPSLQTRDGIPGGIDRAGSLPAGAPFVGHVGDDDDDGYLDGLVVGVTNMPLQNMFLPGSPAVQARTFTTDIPITPSDAALLTVAGALRYESLLRCPEPKEQRREPQPKVGEIAVQSAPLESWPRLVEELGERLDAASRILKRVRHASSDESSLKLARASMITCGPESCRHDSRYGDACLARLAGTFGRLHSVKDRLARQSTLH